MKQLLLFITLLAPSSTIWANTFFFQQEADEININTNINSTHKKSQNQPKNEDKLDRLTTLDALNKIKWEVGLVSAEALREGLSDWNWGSSSFHFAHEGWLGAKTKSGGADKFGHMYSSYIINEIFTKRLMRKTNNKAAAAKKAALFSSSIMLWLEVADGFSKYGFAYEDVAFNTLGVGLSYLRNTVPGLDKKLDLRMEYHPTHNSDRPVIDYSGQRNVFVVKLGGFDKFRSTPLKYLELQLGYQARGYTKDDKKYFKEKSTEVFAGIGINLTETVFKPLKKHTDNALVDYTDTFFQYYQAPDIYLSTSIHKSTAPFK